MAEVQRQIVLPMRKAGEIAYKSIRLRLARSLVVTAGIVLALAFLMSILVSEAVVSGMRNWVAQAGESRGFIELRKRQDAVEGRLVELVARLRALPNRSGEGGGRVGQPDPAEFARAVGKSVTELRRELGGLPVSNDEMLRAGAVDPALVRSWVTTVREDKEIRDQLSSPQRLEAKMRAEGVPSTPEEILNNRVQKRWLVGLALLVAFVGILNAMLMSVTERFREIGTMKCLGALDSFIIKLFLIESLLQGVVGTVIGVVTGMILALAGGWVKYGGVAVANLPLGEVAGYFGFCVVVGVLLTVGGALYPAWQAARMQPIEAMRADV